jgi:hypothetical protein
MKKITLLCYSLAIAASLHAQRPTYGLVAYYPFNGNADDESGNNNNGTVYGATLTTDRFGIANSAYAFDGTSNYISIPDLTNSDISSFSISIWLLNLQGTIGMNGFYHGAASGEWVVWNNGMGVHLSDNAWYAADIGLLDSTWTHFAGIYNKGNSIKVYLNGQLATETPVPDNDMAVYSGYHSTIGAYNNGTTNYWQGKIDDAYIYNRALTLTEIDSIYHEGGWAGIRENINDRFITIYPNLSTGRFILSCSDAMRKPTIIIFNVLGDVVHCSAIVNPESEIDLSNNAKGIYFVRIYDGKKTYSKKIVLQ